MCVFLLEKWSLKFHTKCENLTLVRYTHDTHVRRIKQV